MVLQPNNIIIDGSFAFPYMRFYNFFFFRFMNMDKSFMNMDKSQITFLTLQLEKKWNTNFFYCRSSRDFFFYLQVTFVFFLLTLFYKNMIVINLSNFIFIRFNLLLFLLFLKLMMLFVVEIVTMFWTKILENYQMYGKLLK